MLSSYVMVILYSEQSAIRYIQVKLDISGFISRLQHKIYTSSPLLTALLFYVFLHFYIEHFLTLNVFVSIFVFVLRMRMAKGSPINGSVFPPPGNCLILRGPLLMPKRKWLGLPNENIFSSHIFSTNTINILTELLLKSGWD